MTVTRAAGGNNTTHKNQKPEAETHKPNTQTKPGLAALGLDPALYPEVNRNIEKQKEQPTLPEDHTT